MTGKKKQCQALQKRMPTGVELSIFQKPMMPDLTRKECFREQNFPFLKSLARIYAVQALSRYTRRNQRRSLWWGKFSEHHGYTKLCITISLTLISQKASNLCRHCTHNKSAVLITRCKLIRLQVCMGGSGSVIPRMRTIYLYNPRFGEDFWIGIDLLPPSRTATPCNLAVVIAFLK